MPLQQPIRAKRVEERPDEHYWGIPNRDLTEDEYRALSNEQRELIRGSGLWDVKTDEQMKPAVERTERAAERATEATARAEARAEREGSAD